MISKTYENNACVVRFTLPIAQAAGANQVFLTGDFNEKSSWGRWPMRQTESGFEVELPLPLDRRFEFQYIVDGVYQNDWHADQYRRSPYMGDNSVVSTRRYRDDCTSQPR